MSGEVRTAAKLLIDLALMNAATILACALKFEPGWHVEYAQVFAYYAPLLTLFRLFFLYAAGVYRSMWRYASLEHIAAVALGTTLGSAVFYVLVLVTHPGPYPLGLLLLDLWASLSLLAAARVAYKLLRRCVAMRTASPKRVLIVGAGDAGVTVVAEMKSQRNGHRPVGFVDDDPYKHGKAAHGLPVMGACSDIPEIVTRHSVDEILIACAVSPAERLKEIVALARGHEVSVRVIPELQGLLSGEAQLQNPYNVRPEDLLDRPETRVDTSQFAGCFTGKRILVSGAGGSIGSELCRQLAAFDPSELYLLDENENGIFDVDQDLKGRYEIEILQPVVADVKDAAKLNRVFDDCRPDIVFHAAAHKHVPMMEMYPEEAVKTNIFGTRNIAMIAAKHGCEKFVLISTDKAVEPSSVMGATKRAAEVIVQEIATESESEFITVRFGNVLDSSGSLLPILRKQIAQGGPVTITHPGMERFFMTIPEAVGLVLLAAAQGQSGQTMVLDMGEPMSILELADKLIRLSGKAPGRDIEIVFTGIRPGEKLTEEFLSDDEKSAAQQVGDLLVLPNEPVDFRSFRDCLARLELALPAMRPEEVKQAIRELTPSYQPVLYASGRTTVPKHSSVIARVPSVPGPVVDESSEDDISLPAAA